MVRTAASWSARRAGRSPTWWTEVSPAPMPRRTRPGAYRSTVAMLEASTVGWRVTVERELGAEPKAVDADLAPGETDTKVIVEQLAKVLKRW